MEIKQNERSRACNMNNVPAWGNLVVFRRAMKLLLLHIFSLFLTAVSKAGLYLFRIYPRLCGRNYISIAGTTSCCKQTLCRNVHWYNNVVVGREQMIYLNQFVPWYEQDTAINTAEEIYERS